MKRGLIILIFLGLLALFVGYLFSGKIFSEEFLSNMDMKSSYSENITKDMRLIHLDYMNKKEVDLCSSLLETLKVKHKNVSFSFSKNIENKDRVYDEIGLKCNRNTFLEAINELDVTSFSYFKLKKETLLSYKRVRDFVEYVNVNIEDCTLNKERVYLASDRSFILTKNGKSYFISEWFSEDKYVFYYMEEPYSYNELVCRFDIIKN